MTANLFSELALKPQLLTRLNAMGFDTMTPVQAASLPSLMAGKDVIAQASTGSGTSTDGQARRVNFRIRGCP